MQADLATVLLIVGALFLVRFALGIRRIAAASESPASFVEDLRRAPSQNAFGETAEPERRHAMRQLWTGIIFLVTGVAIIAIILVSGTLGV